MTVFGWVHDLVHLPQMHLVGPFLQVAQVQARQEAAVSVHGPAIMYYITNYKQVGKEEREKMECIK